jgi:hypothetical protein
VCRWSQAVDRPFRLPVPHELHRARFHAPLIEPGVRISRTRLSDKASCVRPRESSRARRQLDESQCLIQVLVGES